LWRHLGPQPLTGFSHGAAGFAYALAALAKSSGVEAFAAAARDCLTYERKLFSPERGNWPDLREFGMEKEPHWPCQWCHGAGGIGLARIGMQRFGAVGLDLTVDIKAAVETVCRLGPSPIDTLCCGNFGNAELLAEAADALGQGELAVLALSRLHGVLVAAAKSGAFGWDAGDDDTNLGLFRGLAGVGYALLRRLAPEAVPNILIWE
jgi:lantibiotic modifying enzyme